MKSLIAAVAIACLGVTTLSAQPAESNDKYFDRLKALVGEWQGPYEWSGARSGKGDYQARYSLTGLGSAVVEDLITPGGEIAMTSIYHRDGADLRMTHYCATRVQTRMKATSIDEPQETVRFSFVDATNLQGPDAPHVNGFAIRFHDADHVTLFFTFTARGETSQERIELRRIGGTSAK
jgi:hypothetical protein